MLTQSSSFILDTESNNNIAQAWEAFTGSTDTKPVKVRPIISNSWLQSRALGIRPETERAPTVIPADEIEENIRTSDLGIAGTSVLNGLSDILHDTKHVVVLADAEGRILYSVGHKQVQDKLEKINFRPGGVWSEETVGPNGVGTSLALKRPEIVMGYEHYCKGWHPWVCYGAPIIDETNQSVRGTIDITGPVEGINREAMALSMSVAQSVQSGLSIIGFRRREILHDIARKELKRWPNNGIIASDENGYIVDYNSQAIEYLNLDPMSFSYRSLHQLLPRLTDAFTEIKKHKSQQELLIHASDNHSFFTNRITLLPVIKDDKYIGMKMIVAVVNDDQKKRLKHGPAQKKPQSKYSLANIKGNSKKMEAAKRFAKAAACDPLCSNILLIGETGTGKELFAHAIHSESSRRNQAFIEINCAAIPKDLIESELFGYVSGAFTGANREGMKGKFELAHNGTLFLDEINSMSMEMQSKLLRVLDSMEITQIGGATPVSLDVRIIAAANENIQTELDHRMFRSDLFHRLSVLEIYVPNLSERGNDIIELANDFLRTECSIAGKPTLELTPEVEQRLLGYKWPGNVRELQNLCRRWVLAVTDSKVCVKDLPEKMLKFDMHHESIRGKSLHSIGDEMIKRTLEQTNNNISEAARILGIDRTTIYRRKRNW